MNKPIQKEIGSAWLDEQKSEVRGSMSVSAEVAAKTGGLRMNPRPLAGVPRSSLERSAD